MRSVVLVPESAHGTNPATAAFCGYRVEDIPANADGRVDLQALKARLGPDVAAVMITNPNTCGLFERDMKYIADAVHKAGAFVYCEDRKSTRLNPVTTAHLVCSLMLEKKNKYSYINP